MRVDESDHEDVALGEGGHPSQEVFEPPSSGTDAETSTRNATPLTVEASSRGPSTPPSHIACAKSFPSESCTSHDSHSTTQAHVPSSSPPQHYPSPMLLFKRTSRSSPSSTHGIPPSTSAFPAGTPRILDRASVHRLPLAISSRGQKKPSLYMSRAAKNRWSLSWILSGTEHV
ncbi:hypothetical protein SISSUDRAFT_1043732 [Sistotremastrum suecicum HHB10207 ss-3]|uniref:Uncharacterized protein n=1 Tax=Sistotremastrum suecicum HHB10207 ss-3 TaxID=1314776 RepID=A0A166FLZ7_9AGAM|nr:hypothetical protein SISSUDRAFT_1043732 [Sistotremastrum suecicum HHB10207 ss-3]